MRWFTVLTVAVLHAGISKAQEAESEHICGVSNPGTLVFRFQAEGNTDFGEFPWMVAILKKSNSTSSQWSDKEYISAGTLIHPSVVLTNAYSIDNINANEIKCRAGEWDKSNDEEIYVHQERNVRKIVKHQDFDKNSVYNSVSLLFLDEPVTLTDPHIGAACVGQALPAPGTECLGAGWGHSGANKSDILKKIPVSLLSAEDCVSKLKETRLGRLFRLHSSLTCATAPNDACKGDAGAPLVCPAEGESTRYTLYGITAYRIQAAGAPCVYVNVPEFYSWVGERMAEEGLNDKSYTYLLTTKS